MVIVHYGSLCFESAKREMKIEMFACKSIILTTDHLTYTVLVQDDPREPSRSPS